MKIVHLTPYYAPAYPFGGVVRVVEALATGQAARGHQVTVLTTDAGNQAGARVRVLAEQRDGVRVLRARNALPLLRGRLNLSTPLHLTRLATPVLAEADVLHLHEFRTLENVLLTPLAQRLGVPMVLSPHGTLAHGTGRSRLKQAWDKWLSPALGGRIAQVIALNEAERTDAQALWAGFWRREHPTEFHVIPNGVDAQAFATLPDPAPLRARLGIAADERVLLYMGRLHPRKGADVLARAFLRANLPRVRLVIAGADDGLGAELARLADARVQLAGFLAGEERLQALAMAHAFALPARGEGMSIAVLEALAAGVPVLISPECYLPDVAEVGAGVVCAPSEEALASALPRFFTDDATHARMATAARALVAARYTWQRVLDALDGVYRACKRQ